MLKWDFVDVSTRDSPTWWPTIVDSIESVAIGISKIIPKLEIQERCRALKIKIKLLAALSGLVRGISPGDLSGIYSSTYSNQWIGHYATEIQVTDHRNFWIFLGILHQIRIWLSQRWTQKFNKSRRVVLKLFHEVAGWKRWTNLRIMQKCNLHNSESEKLIELDERRRWLQARELFDESRSR